MDYKSTRNSSLQKTASQAISEGISADGGLYLPSAIPALTAEQIKELVPLTYCQRAERILSLYLTDFTPEEIRRSVEGAYGTGFADPRIAPVVCPGGGLNILELWHGPTSAFKDMALQILPYLLTISASKQPDSKQIMILVATSGDTGKAALEGFADVDGVSIQVFYPQDGVSPMQKRQMTTQEGKNVSVCAIEGNFDDAQSGVKKMFTDPVLAKKLAEMGIAFSSANSINWGRLLPQIVYYFSGYCDMVAQGTVSFGDPINVCVPTGNFGNILAAYFARCMGLPVNKLVCASNANNVLTDFFATGTYDKKRPFHTTISPSMDILISSNLERLLYLVSGENDQLVKEWMDALSKDGAYRVSEELQGKIGEVFCGGCCDDTATKEEIRRVFEEYGYLADPHTAVALRVYREYREASGDETPVLIASTASPYKFAASVAEAIAPELLNRSEEEMLKGLAERSGLAIPERLANLFAKPVRFAESCEKDRMEDALMSFARQQSGK
ncbi:MAG: threonine synthase [Oscillospiraceae bacterium]|nr:threonine synthase [Oscillospiraceae bacterium]